MPRIYEGNLMTETFAILPRLCLARFLSDFVSDCVTMAAKCLVERVGYWKE